MSQIVNQYEQIKSENIEIQNKIIYRVNTITNKMKKV